MDASHARQLVLGLALALAAGFVSPGSRAADAPAIPDATPAAQGAIAVEAQTGSDAKIRARIRQLFDALGLGDVVVEVTGGVVALSGEAPTAAAHDQALEIVRRIEGVAEVRNRIIVSRDLAKRLGQMQDRIVARVYNVVSHLPLLLVAGVVLLFFWWLSKAVTRSERVTRRFSQNAFVRDLIRQVLRFGIIGVGVMLALEVLDASRLVTSLLGAAGVVGLAVGFALRDTVENYIASLLLSLRQPFSRDDLVAIDGSEGRVLRLNARATVLLTLDGNHLRIPNARVYKAIILNYTRNPKRRFQFDVGVDTEQNLAEAQNLAATTLADMQGVLDDPPPMCRVETLGDSNVVLRVFGWVDQDTADFLKVRSEAIRLVKGAFDRAGIVMPEPIYNLRIGSLPGVLSHAVPTAGPTPLPAEAPAAKEMKREDTAEPDRAIDIHRRDELADQIDASRSPGEEDLLHARAAQE